MKSKDMQTGVVYAYREGERGRVKTVIVISKASLWESHWNRTHGPKFTTTGATTPRSGSFTSVGYLVLMADNWTYGVGGERVDPGEMLAPYVGGEDVLLEAARVAQHGDTDTPFPPGVRLTVVNHRHIIGEYAAFKAEQDEIRQREAQYRARQNEEEGRRREVRSETLSALAARGIRVRDISAPGVTENRYSLNQETADRLIELLGAAK